MHAIINKAMSQATRQYQVLLDDIKHQLNRIKTDKAPEMAPEIGAEIQRHLNRVLADVAESARIPEDDKEWWTRR